MTAPAKINATSCSAGEAALVEMIEQLTCFVEAGNHDGAAAFVDEHPEHAATLGRLLPSIAALAALDELPFQSGDDATGGDPTAGPARRTLGDFHIRREIGRGGMGIVYEAEQLSLGRRVAVKVLPFAAMLDERQLARFKNEARAAASLHHPHIVPVHYVGVERGVHFYAMQYIEGKSLAERRSEECGVRNEGGGDLRNADFGLRNEERTDATSLPKSAIRNPQSEIPTHAVAAAATLPGVASPAHFRRIAELGVQAAEALHYAHESGVIHRDVKPSNLLVEPSGHLWVADFGLARIGADASLTVTGDLLGTLRYMSPEQLRGKAAMVDHRTDVYSLGVTLYELLTSRPAFTGESSEQLLDQILNAEPPAPRTHNRAIPADLETIVLKAIAKDAPARYATAQDLADDLRRFVDAKPIVARRPTLVDRAVMWTRRHAGVALATGAALVATALIAVAAASLIGRSSRQEAAARQQADERLRFARRVVDDMYTKVAEGWLADEPGMTPLQEEFLVKAAEFYRVIADNAPDDPQSQADAAMAEWRLVGILPSVGRMGESEDLLRSALARLEAALAAEPDNAEFAHRWAVVAMNLAWLLGELHNPPEAIKLGAAAAERWEVLSRRYPNERKYRRYLVDLSQNLGAGLAFIAPFEAEPHLRRAVVGYERALADKPPGATVRELAIARMNLGSALIGQSRFAEAEGELTAAIAGFETLAPAGQAPAEVIQLHAKAGWQRAESLFGLNRWDEAAQAADGAIANYEMLAKEFPDRPLYEGELKQARALRERIQSSRTSEQGVVQ